MIKVYGMPSCPDCARIEPLIEGNTEFEYIDIGKNVRDLRAFLNLRDHNPAFDEIKKHGGIGIPCFVYEDGRVTLAAEEVGLGEMKSSCRLDGKGC